MRWKATLIALLMLIMPGSIAQWVKFEACGLLLPEEVEQVPGDYITGTAEAPNYGPIWIWVPSISVVAGITEKPVRARHVRCTMIYALGEQTLVIGTLQEVMTKLKSAAH